MARTWRWLLAAALPLVLAACTSPGSGTGAGAGGTLLENYYAIGHSSAANDGAALVRPDRFIAWRSLAGASEPRAALSQILAGPSGTPAASGV